MLAVTVSEPLTVLPVAVAPPALFVTTSALLPYAAFTELASWSLDVESTLQALDAPEGRARTLATIVESVQGPR